MKKLSLIIILMSVFISCKENKTSNKEEVKSSINNKIESYLKEQQKTHEIPGLAVAIIKNNKTIYKGYFGEENLDTKKKVNEETIFPVYSVTKLITATAIFKLIEEGKINVNDTIAMYISDLPIEWRDITIANLLTHSSGLPDFSLLDSKLTNNEVLEKIAKEDLLFTKGAQWRYNQTNYWFLAKIIEKVTTKKFKEYVLEEQFGGNTKNVFISSNFKDTIKNRVNRYDYDVALNQYKKTSVDSGIRAHAANGLNISLEEFIVWNTNFDANKYLNEGTKKLMWQPFNFTEDERVFLHGWDVYTTNNAASYGFTGGVQTGFRKFVKNDLTIIFLTNGYKYYPVHNTIIDHLAGIVDDNLLDKNILLQEEITNAFLIHDFEKAKEILKNVLNNNNQTNFEGTLNRVGYLFLRKNQTSKAIKVFKLNTELYPKSANTFDSLGEGYYKAKAYKHSKENYEKSLLLNPKNNNAVVMIKKIDSKQ